MSNFNSSFLDELKAKSDIVDIISKFVHLQKKGRDYWACCPFHHEKTPSFQVRADHQFFKCFGCQKSGNVITFVMEHERMTYPEAVEWLAERANLKLPEDFESAEYKEIKQLKEKIHNANKEAAKFYFQTLFSPAGAEALQYLLKRGLTEQTIKTFGMGFSPNSWSLPQYMEKKGYDKSTLKKAGLCGYDDDSGKAYDFFSGRVMVPIIDSFGNVIGFGGRVLKDTGFAKYKNTLANPVFDKSRSLFNINLFKKLKQSETVQSAILVEGYMDTISLYQAGIKNVVAPMGTSLTLDQCRMLKRYVDLVFVCFDGDSAGQAATMRSLELLKSSGLEVKVMELPDKMDPDDVIKKKGTEVFEALITKALPLIDYKLKKTEGGHSLSSADGRQKYVKAAAEVLSKLDAVEREVYARTVSEKSGIAIATVLSEAAGVTDDALSQPPKARPKETKTRKGSINAARYVLSALMNMKGYVKLQYIKPDFFDDEAHQAVYGYFVECVNNRIQPKISDLFDLTEDREEINEIIEAVDKVAPEKQAEYYLQCITFLFNDYKKELTHELMKRLSQAKSQKEISELKEKIKELTNSQPI
ncbi:MAG: DNA primase [Clostridia bacterium]|nr:DNA primase [Clostridia bacterium]